jgi:hypothetical protein
MPAGQQAYVLMSNALGLASKVEMGEEEARGSNISTWLLERGRRCMHANTVNVNVETEVVAVRLVITRPDADTPRRGDLHRGRVEIGVHRVPVTKPHAGITSSFAEVERQLLSVCGCETVGGALVEIAPRLRAASMREPCLAQYPTPKATGGSVASVR